MASFYRSLVSIGCTGLAALSPQNHSASGALTGDSDVIDDTQDIGTSSELVTFGEITAGGAALIEIRNLDPDNFVSIGFENPVVAGTKTFKILPKQSTLLCHPSAALYAIADTAAVKILKRAIEL